MSSSQEGGGRASYGEQWTPSEEDRCYRHPDRTSFTLCQRCGRTICPECQTQAPVGVICPECMQRDRRETPSARQSPVRRAARSGLLNGVNGVIGVTVAITLVQFLVNLLVRQDVLAGALGYAPLIATPPGEVGEPWRIVTQAFVHGSIMHIAFNMLSLWIFGRAVEAVLGTPRFLLLYLAGIVGGAAGVSLLGWQTFVIGASGAIFALMGAYFVMMRRAQMNTTALVILLALNLAMGFLDGGVSWQAHLGGMVTGLIAGWMLLRDVDSADKRANTGIWMTVGLLLALVVLIYVSPLFAWQA